MATPRKHWFRVADSIRAEPWTNDQVAFLIRLMAELNTRWARNGLDADAAHSVELNSTDLMAISGKHRADVARKSAERLADIASISVSHRGDITLISWPKYSEFQGLITRESPESRPLRNLPRKTPPQPQTEKRTETPAAFALTSDPVDPSDPTPLLNLIANQDGERDEKAAWLEAEWPLIQAEAEAEGNPKRVKPIAIRFYRNYLKSDRRFRNWAAKQETRRRVAEHEAKFAGVIEELEREEGYAAAHR